MNDEAFRNELKKVPFQQFDIKTTDGDTFRVIHPDYAMVSPDGETVIAFEQGSHYRVVSMQHVVSLEPVRQPPSRKGKR